MPRTTFAPRVRIERRLAAADRRAALLDETFWSLRATPKQLSPTWLYDERGSLLFDEITRLPEYYPTRCETEILRARAGEIASQSRAETLVELGSGTSQKTRLLLDALDTAGTLRRFVPLDVSEEVLVQAARDVAEAHRGIEVVAVVGDFARDLDAIPDGGSRLVAFLGSTIGNLYPDERARFLAAVAATLDGGDRLLLGLDLAKDVARLEAAYDDSRGLTEAFVRNALAVLDRELGSSFSHRRFRYEARWVAEHSWIDLRLVSVGAQRVEVPELEVTVDLADGEPLRIEVSTKFTRERVAWDLAAAGLGVERWWTDPNGDFALCLSRKLRDRVPPSPGLRTTP